MKRYWQQGSVITGLALGAIAQPAWTEADAIPRLKQQNRPATTVKEWRAQIEAQTVQVTGVRLDRTDTGLEITLETAEGRPLQIDATKFRTEGNSLIADIPNAVLALPNAQVFKAENPTGGHCDCAGGTARC
jgi:iron complex outermembrane receptor protein